MIPKPRRHRHDLPHVALLIETSLASGRGVLLGIGRYLREHGPWSTFCEPRDLAGRIPAWLKTWRGDGVIARIENHAIAEAVLATGLPIVDVLGMVQGIAAPLVHVDNQAIARSAAEHLIERGFEHFGYCGLANTYWSQDRERAFLRTLEIMGHRCSVFHLGEPRRSDSSWENRQERLTTWITRLPKPVGVMACNDPRGQLVLDACRRAQMKVPDEVAVVGVDNDRAFCDVAYPPLSSIDPNTEMVGYQAASLMDHLMRGKRAPRAPLLIPPARVVVRESTDVLAINDQDVSKALAFIRQAACQEIGVDDVVAQVLIARTELNLRFQKVLHRGVHEEIVRVRVNRAADLIRHSELPLKEIARRCGFRHAEYMGVVFRRVLGQTPGQVRAEKSWSEGNEL
jgi:LacI family transcriptional regulator